MTALKPESRSTFFSDDVKQPFGAGEAEVGKCGKLPVMAHPFRVGSPAKVAVCAGISSWQFIRAGYCAPNYAFVGSWKLGLKERKGSASASQVLGFIVICDALLISRCWF
jgi:hypothetical protein